MISKYTTILVCLLTGLPALPSETASGEVAVEDCATCHRAIHDEWSGSLHADAWSSPVFHHRKEAVSTSGDSSCDCHAPVSVAGPVAAAAPAPRDSGPHEGVDCLSCHVDSAGTIWSSGERIYVPHWTRQAGHYSTAAFCATCHTWAEGSEFDCQACHMQTAEGAPADAEHADDGSSGSHSSHRFNGSRDPEFLAGGAELAVIRDGDNIRIELTSLVPAHQFPVVKHHSLVLALTSTDGHAPAWSEKVVIPPEETLGFTVPPADGEAVELRFYPSAEVWPDSFYVLQRQPVR